VSKITALSITLFDIPSKIRLNVFSDIMHIIAQRGLTLRLSACRNKWRHNVYATRRDANHRGLFATGARWLLGNGAACDEDKWLLMQIFKALRVSETTTSHRQMLLYPNCASTFAGNTTNYCAMRAQIQSPRRSRRLTRKDEIVVSSLVLR